MSDLTLRLMCIVLLIPAQGLLAASAGIPHPAEDLPPGVADSWKISDDPAWADLAMHGMTILTEGAQVEYGRVDLFQKINGSWRWTSTRRLSRHRAAVERSFRGAIGVLLRSPQKPESYAWAECDVSRDTCALTWLRTVRVNGLESSATITLFAGVEPQTLTAISGRDVSFIPEATGILCARTDVASACGALSRNRNVVQLEGWVSHDMLHVVNLHEECANVKTTMAAPGRASSMPKLVKLTSICGGAWGAFASASAPPPGAVMDFESPESALRRLTQDELPALPSYAELRTKRDRGISISPTVGDRDTTPEPGATVYVFETESLTPGRVPLTSATVDVLGIAFFPSLGRGSYWLKLVSALSSRKLISADLAVETVTKLRFPAGPVVRGTLRLVAPVQTVAPAQVRIAPEVDMTRPEPIAGDLTDLVNSVAADADGRFTIALTTRGKYRLTAEWGHASASLPFEVKDDERDIDLGEITLSSGATLRGTVKGCAATQLSVATIPDPQRATMGQYLRIPVEPNGSFYSEGLRSGRWMVMVICGTTLTAVMPESFTVTDGAPLQIDFAVGSSTPP